MDQMALMLLDYKNGDSWRTKYIDMRKIDEIEYDYVVLDEIGYPKNRRFRPKSRNSWI